MKTKSDMRIAIIGAGPAGIGAGYELLKQGFTEFTIFDTLDAPGGTWHLHSYPGLACDVWAHSYTFSYAPNPDWTASFVNQPEIQAYLQRCATEFGLDPHLTLNTRIDSAEYIDDGRWKLTDQNGTSYEFDAVINAMGNQHTPLFPDVEGMDSFQGPSFHGTRWDHSVDLKGKRVAIVGSAASAVQIVPEVAKEVAHLTVLQRSANWIMPRGKKDYSDGQRKNWRRFPFLIKLLRKWQATMMGQVEHAVTIGHNRMGQFEDVVKKFIDKSIDDPELRKALLPDSKWGCRRGLVSDEFYPTLNEDHVELIPSGLERVTPTGLVTQSGREVDVDVIVYCTGYRILDFDRIDVRGVGGVSLADVMADKPQSHKGIAVPGFPNYFMSVGPNGLVLNVSYFTTVETNLTTIVRLLGDLVGSGKSAMGVKQEEFDKYNDELADKYAKFSWGAADCNSYYRNASGHAPFLFPGNFKGWQQHQAEAGLHEYELS